MSYKWKNTCTEINFSVGRKALLQDERLYSRKDLFSLWSEWHLCSKDKNGGLWICSQQGTAFSPKLNFLLFHLQVCWCVRGRWTLLYIWYRTAGFEWHQSVVSLVGEVLNFTSWSPRLQQGAAEWPWVTRLPPLGMACGLPPPTATNAHKIAWNSY